MTTRAQRQEEGVENNLNNAIQIKGTKKAPLGRS